MNASFFAGRRGSHPAALLFGALLCGATVVLVWLGYRATAEWRQRDAQIIERRASETLALVSAALSRDMKGAHASTLASATLPQLLLDAPFDLADQFGAAFSRFPYPESFFVWRARPGTGEDVTFFDRAERPPRWQASARADIVYPVVMTDGPSAATDVLELVQRGASPRRPFVILETPLAGARYQVVAHALYTGPDNTDLAAIIGYTVNLEWVRLHYFGDLIAQVPGIGSVPDGPSVHVFDGQGVMVAATAGPPAGGVTTEREFPLSFFDPALVPASNRPSDIESWRLRVAVAQGGSPMAADATRRMFVLIGLAAAAAMVGLFLAIRAVRVTAEVAALKSEFVSTVTHQIKTPIAGMKLVAETIAMGRCTSPDTMREYGTLLSLEAGRLTKLVENLLAYARLSDVSQAYSLERLEPSELVDEALQRCGLRIAELGFSIDNTVPPHLVRIEADRSAIVQVIENVIDNAIAHSAGARTLAVSGRADGDSVQLAVCDSGPGIPADELPHVFDKFFRGRQASSGGSGLGLTIAGRIVKDHGGRIEIESAPGAGTTVRIILPARAS